MGQSTSIFDQRLVEIEQQLAKVENKKVNLDLIKSIYIDNSLLIDILKNLNSNVQFNN